MAKNKKISRRINWRSCLVVTLILLLGLYLGLRGLGAFLITGDPLERGDAVVVLGGGPESRVAEAVRLVKEHYGLWLIITEPGEAAAGQPGSQVFRNVAILDGISPDVILITEKTAQNTIQEAAAVRDMMEKRQLHTVIVVTDPFHTRRTRIIFRDEFARSGLTVRVHPVLNHWYRSTSWFLSHAGWEATIREYGKLFAYFAGIHQVLE